MVNLRGSVGGKYGANTHFSTHLRRRILQAAQGLTTTGGRGGGGDGGAAEGEPREGEGKGVGDCEGGEEDEDGGEFDSIVGTWIGIGGEGVDVVVFTLYSIVSCEKQRKTEQIRLMSIQ